LLCCDLKNCKHFAKESHYIVRAICNMWLSREIFFIREPENWYFRNAIFYVQQSDISQRQRSRNWCTISTGLIIDVMQMYGKINLTAASPRRFHFNSKDVRSPACRRNYNSFNPWLAGTFSAMQTQPESGKSGVTLHRVTGGVLHRFSFLISFVLTTSARHCNRTTKQTLA